MATKHELPKKPLTARQEQIQQALENGYASGSTIIMKPQVIVRRKALKEIQQIIEKAS